MSNLLTYEEAGELLHISPVTLRRWTMQRRIPFVKLGYAVRFDQAELERWIAAQRVEAAGVTREQH